MTVPPWECAEPVSAEALNRQVQGLYVEHHRWLQAWLRRKLDCPARAADLMQDTFVRLLARDEAVELREPRAFLTTVAQRLLYNHWRREALEQAWQETLAHLPPETMPSPEQRAILLETLTEIDRLLDGLPLAVRRAFLMAQLDGLPQAEIARRLGVSLATVKRHLVRAGLRCYFALDLR